VTKKELEISKIELTKANMQIRQTAEKLYYGIMILQKKEKEDVLNLAVAKAKLYDGESALQAGKITNSAIAGLNAAEANEEQNLLKIKIQIDDYTADLKQLTGIPDTVPFLLDSISINDFKIAGLKPDSYLQKALSGNIDLAIVNMEKKKAEFAGKAGTYSYLPEIGLTGGYSYQQGLTWYPEKNAFAGLLLKWNITDMISNAYVKSQRDLLEKQAAESIANTQDQIKTDLAKAFRKLSQSADLIAVAKKVVYYRREDVKYQTDRQNAGMNTTVDLLSVNAALEKAEADMFAAQLDYRMAITDLQILAGVY
jgi:outer membrane protein TolC